MRFIEELDDYTKFAMTIVSAVAAQVPFEKWKEALSALWPVERHPPTVTADNILQARVLVRGPLGSEQVWLRDSPSSWRSLHSLACVSTETMLDDVVFGGADVRVLVFLDGHSQDMAREVAAYAQFMLGRMP